MPPTEIRVPQGLTTEGLLARRYIARFADSLVLLVLAAVVELAIASALRLSADAIGLLMLPVLLVLWIGYGAALESSPWQATVGKKLLGLRVFDLGGGRISFGRALGRSAVKDGPFLLFSLLPGGQLLSLAWLAAHIVVMHRSQVNQAIHDRTMSTLVAAREETTQLHLT